MKAWYVTGKDEVSMHASTISAEYWRGFEQCDLNYGGCIV